MAKTKNLDSSLTKMTMTWTITKIRPTLTDWQPMLPLPPKADTYFAISLAGGQLPTGDGSIRLQCLEDGELIIGGV
jgi:hypothetical protein